MKINIITAFLILIACLSLQAQDYVDIVKLSSNNALRGNDQNADKTWAVNHNLQVYYPIRATEKLVVLTGFTVEHTNLNLFEGSSYENLFMTRLNLGIKHQHTERLSGTYLFLPKIASNFRQIGMQDIQFGGIALLDYKISDYLKLKLGIYVSSENHGSTITPLIGLWYRTPNRKFYINAVLPIRMDVNYNIVDHFSVGADLLTSVKSYDLSANTTNRYAHENSIRMGAYLAYGFMENSLILRVRGGYDLTRYGLYNSGDRVGGQLLLWALAGDNRNQLNPNFVGGFCIGADLIYRFDLSKENK